MRDVLRLIEQEATRAVMQPESTRLEALAAIVGLAKRGQSDLAPTNGAAAVAAPTSQSSVQIEGRQKGPPAITVKVYDADPAEALVAATTLYDQAVAKYAERAKVGAEEGV